MSLTHSYFGELLIRLEFFLLTLLIGAGSTCELPGYWQCSIYGPGWCYINGKPACVSSLYPYHYQRFTSLLTPDDTILSLRDTH